MATRLIQLEILDPVYSRFAPVGDGERSGCCSLCIKYALVFDRLCTVYTSTVFSYNNYKWFWIPTFCPLVGGVLGAWIYQFFLGI